MKSSAYRKKWIELHNCAALDKDDLSRLSRQIAFSFLDRYIQRDSYGNNYINLLCEMATSFTDANLNDMASSALFEIIVERLCDNFEDFPLETYIRIMSQVISYCRKLPEGEKLNRCLKAYGVTSFRRLFNRALTIHTQQYSYDVGRPLQRAILLSRVTIGADVAITSVIIQRLLQLYPNLEIVVVGSPKLKGIFGGNSRIRLRHLTYSRRGGLLDRFESWYAALDILAQEVPSALKNRALVIDPDSRISQLGVLPLTLDGSYLFFNSRGVSLASSHLSMAESVNRWLDSVFGLSSFCYPKVWVPDLCRFRADKTAAALRRNGCRKILAINFGVGGNPRKRVNSEFENKLLLEILKVPKTVIILDQGFGAEETARSTRLAQFVKSKGYQTVETGFDGIENSRIPHGVISVECEIGEMASLIAASDSFIGYDSACQHISAALGVPTVTIFAGTNNMGFIRRWSACGNTRCNIVHVNTLENPSQLDIDDVVLRITGEVAAAVRKPPRIRIADTKSRLARDVAGSEGVVHEAL